MALPTIFELLDLTGKTAIVTGGAMGIGRAIAERLAEAGANVMITDIDHDVAMQAAGEICAAGGIAEAMHADAASPEDAEKAVQAVKTRFGGLDILVNNAAIFPFAPMMQMTTGMWDRVLNLNLRGAFFWSQTAAKAMIEHGKGGRIVNIASVDGLHPTGGLAHYDASKGGLIMLTKSMAVELAPHGILVNAIAPGAVNTPGAAAAALPPPESGVKVEDYASGFLQRIPLRRTGEPDEIARAVLFLASEACSYMTGALIVVDGGYLLS